MNPPPIDISPFNWEIVRAILQRRIPEHEVWAFGSRAQWTSREYSDLDLAVIGDQPLALAVRAALVEDLEESDLPFKVDVVEWATTKERFRRIIEKDCVVVQAGAQGGPGTGPGMVASGWIPTRLGELVEIKHGWPFKSVCFDRALTGGPIVVSVGNFRYTGGFRFEETAVKEYRGGYPREYELAPHDILLVMTCQTAGGEILGIPAKVPNDGKVYLHNQRLGKVVVQDSTRVDADYLYFLFQSQDFNRELVTTASGTKILHTAPSRIEAFCFELPPLPEQRAIAHILGTLDDKIELNRRMNETLEAQAAALFKSWFLDFDPVRTKAEGCDTGLPKPIADLFPGRLVDSELGEIPEGWEVQSLDAIADYQNGLALQKYRPADGDNGLPVVKIAQLRSGQPDSGEWATATIRPECIIDDGDIVFSWSGSLMVKVWCGGRAALNQHLFKVTSARLPKWFYLHCTLAHLPDFQRIAAGKATTMGHIKRQHLGDAKCVVPSEEFFSAVEPTFAAFLERITSLAVENRTLSALRNTLLPKLISGELRVPEVAGRCEG